MHLRDRAGRDVFVTPPHANPVSLLAFSTDGERQLRVDPDRGRLTWPGAMKRIDGSPGA